MMSGPSAPAAGPAAKHDTEPAPSGDLLRGAGRICGVLFAIMLGVLVAERLWFATGTSPKTLAFLWQIPGVEVMRRLPWQSIWYWHAYPSGFVAYWVLLVKLFGDHGCETACQTIYLLGAAALPAMTYVIGLAVIGNRTAALVAAVVLGASPTLPLFSAYFIYDMPTMVLVTAAVAAIALHQLTGRAGWLVAALWLTGVLVFVRAMYHLVLLLPLAVAVVRARPGRTMLAAAAGALVLPTGMYLKNLLVFGFFGSSSMFGFNYSKMVVWALPPEQLAYFRDAGDIAPIVADYPLFYAMIAGPQIYRQYGYTATGPSELLNRNDVNNINLVAVAQEYGRSARAVMWWSPSAIAYPASLAYWRFCSPPARSEWFNDNPARIGPYRTAYLDLFYGEGVGRLIDRLTGWGRMPALTMPLLPLLIGGFLAGQIAVCRASPRRWRAAAAGRPTLFVVMGVMTYTTLLSSLLEVAENDRYFTYIEPLFVVSTVGAVVWILRATRDRVLSKLRTPGGVTEAADRA